MLPEILRYDVRIEGVHPDAERHLALELRRGARQHHVPAALGQRTELVEHARLADAGLPLERHIRGLAPAQGIENRLERSALILAADEPRTAAVR